MTHDELLRHIDKATLVATAKDADGERATIRTWHGLLGHPLSKVVVALAGSGANSMLIMD